MGQYGEKEINRNRAKTLDFCQVNGSMIGNTFWQQKIGKNV